MRSPRDFLKPLALGAPEPPREIAVKPSRCIHFFDPSNPKMAGKLPEVAKQRDILLGNLEDAIPADRKVEAREGLVKIAREVDFSDTPIWTRVNSLDSPWFLDDVTRLVASVVLANAPPPFPGDIRAWRWRTSKAS
jgi:malyl-CoA/(S)-citramalyl-CoA lyase